MKSAEIRKAFLDYFAEQGHEVVASSPLVPGNDPTLLFTNAGMVQFKDVFTGRETRPYARAASSQRCVRAGGKHNDLENVGYTARHHTFFEMLGNFSFGDYFKRDAIQFAWRLLTDRLGLPSERLWVTVHDSDDEAEAIWVNEIGVPADRVTRMGDKDNFWAMGDTGPCGPCSEIFYDHGPEVPGGPPGTPEEDGDRYVEIWNLVFMQYERGADGALKELPRPSVDTGMGLERIAAVLQGVHSNYEIDLFRNLIAAVAQVTDVSVEAAAGQASLRVIADHIRAAAFLMTDGVMPGNEGRGYVLRRIIRRALRHGHKLGCTRPFFHRLVQPLVVEMGEAYPELARAADRVTRALEQEEAQFARTLGTGMEVFEAEVARLDGQVIPGEVVFRLYDTYGFPADLTADVARERGLEIDEEGFEAAMGEQRQRARAASRFAAQASVALDLDRAVEFTGYEAIGDEAEVAALFRREADALAAVAELAAGDEGVVVLDRTPFYAEAGGQVGDTGNIVADGADFEVTDTQLDASQHLHHGCLRQGQLKVGQRVAAHIDAERRAAVARNHSATHLLHAALREILGSHVEQKGSLVAPDRLRFDFAHNQALSAAELEAIEARVNEHVLANSPVATELMHFDAARERGAMALFGEKYGDRVRVLSMGEDFSVELCGGTHVRRTGDIGLMHIVAEQGIASGVRRIEAVTGLGTLAWLRQHERLVQRAADQLRTVPDELDQKVAALLDQQRRLEKQVQQLQGRLASAQGDELTGAAVEVGDVRVLATRLDDVEPKALLQTLDQLKQKLERAVVVLATVQDGKVALIAGVTRDLTDRFKAGDLVRWVGEQVGAKGGGRPDMARAGGGDRPEALEKALEGVAEWVRAGQS